jgi:predicted transposase YbfD/YdcC
MERTLAAASPTSLLGFLETVPDPRSAHGRRHPLAAMRAAVCCAILCGARGFKPIAQWLHDQDISLVHALGFTRKPPQWGAFRKRLIALDPAPLEDALTRWAEAALAGSPPGAEGGDALEPVALDGRAVRGSIGHHEAAVHLLSVMAQRYGLTLRQTGVGAKTNEPKAALGLLKGLVREGRVVTGDAMFCQRELCAQVVRDGGHYFVVVKDNQPELPRDIGDAFTRAADAAFSPRQRKRTARQFTEHRTLDQHGDWIESRRVRATDLLNSYLDWPFVGQVCQVEREVKRRGGEVSREVADAITSATKDEADAARLLGWWRGHWGIENRSHYVRDVTMGEDASRIRTGSGPQILAAFRNATIGWLRLQGVANIAEALRRNAAQVPRLLRDFGILKQ